MKQNLNHKLLDHLIRVHELQEINLEVYLFEFEMEAHLYTAQIENPFFMTNFYCTHKYKTFVSSDY